MRTWFLFALATFLSSFLLFSAELAAGKRLLPYFGGSSSVWAASLVFFTLMLLVGYAYALALARLRLRYQVLLHMLLIVIATIALAGWWVPVVSRGMPTFDIVCTLSIWIGLPFLLLATSPLLQQWYGYSDGVPYGLYAISNLGSFGALILFPFLFEPSLSLSGFWQWWMLGFALLAALLAAIAPRTGSTQMIVPLASPGSSHVLRWIGASALPAAGLVAVTTQVTQVVAPVPLLWMIPLALYLASFVWAFAGFETNAFIAASLVAISVAAYFLIGAPWYLALAQVAAYLALLFLGAFVCHSYLYRSRPGLASLPYFYVALALGGAAGTVFASLFAPLVFSDYWEFPLFIVASGLAGAWSLSAAVPHRLGSRFRTAAVAIACVLFIVMYVQDGLSPRGGVLIERVRGFYGVVSIRAAGPSIAMVHGRTLHGLEMTLPGMAGGATTYYTSDSGIARALRYARAEKRHGISVGVAGLGAGVLAAYCEPGDLMRFYEIDPQVVEMAREHFSFLARCPAAEVRLGDARLVLAAERGAAQEAPYDILAIDAFANDSIPVHLITREALAVYGERVAGDRSIIAFHVSNRYLDLAPMVVRLASDSGYASLVAYDRGDPSRAGVLSTWVLLARDPHVFTSPVFDGVGAKLNDIPSRSWTDDHASILDVLYMPEPFRSIW